jgi:hypothetical protein
MLLAFIQIFIKIGPYTNELESFEHKSGLLWPWMTFEVIIISEKDDFEILS